MESMAINNKILVTGSEGYIGSVLMPILINYGYKVTGLDIGYYAEGNLTNETFFDYKIIRKDIRDITVGELVGFDVVIHLAGLSNDPLGKLDENLTYEINFKASVNLAEKAKMAGVKRFLFSSSCSLYGANEKLISEEDPANPQTAYGRSKILAEEGISKLSAENFSPVYLRNATAFGVSPRMRFDLVVNSLAGFAKTEKIIKILGDGTPWRPLVHVKDISNAILQVLSAPKHIIHNQAFNIGSSEENYQIKKIAQIIKEIYTDSKIRIMEKNAGDTRNYQVSFEKAKNELKFKPKYSLLAGVKEISHLYEICGLSNEIFNCRFYTRLKQIEYLLQEGIINSRLRRIEEIIPV